MTMHLVASCPRCNKDQLTVVREGVTEVQGLEGPVARMAGFVACDRCEWVAEIGNILKGQVD